MKKFLVFLLVVSTVFTLSPGAFAADWILQEGTPMFEPGCVMNLNFGTLTVLDAGFAKKAEMFFSVNSFTRIINGVAEFREEHGPIYYTAKDGFTLFVIKGQLHNTSDAFLTMEELTPELKWRASDEIKMTVYSVVHIGDAKQNVLDPGMTTDVCLVCPVPGALYFGSNDLQMDFAGASLGFPKTTLKSYVSMGFSEMSQPVEDITLLTEESTIAWINGKANEEGAIVAKQPHIDEVRAEDVSLEYDIKRDEYLVHVKLRNLTGYPLIHDKLPNGLYVRLQFLDSSGDVLLHGDIEVGSTSSYSDLAIGKAGWDNSRTYVSKKLVDNAVQIEIASYSYEYIAINNDGTTQSVNGIFTDPFVISISDILS